MVPHTLSQASKAAKFPTHPTDFVMDGLAGELMWYTPVEVQEQNDQEEQSEPEEQEDLKEEEEHIEEANDNRLPALRLRFINGTADFTTLNVANIVQTLEQ